MQVMLPMQEQCCPHSHVATHHQTIFKPLAENCFPIEPLSLKTISGGMDTETNTQSTLGLKNYPLKAMHCAAVGAGKWLSSKAPCNKKWSCLQIEWQTIPWLHLYCTTYFCNSRFKIHAKQAVFSYTGQKQLLMTGYSGQLLFHHHQHVANKVCCHRMALPCAAAQAI